jgi:uncharacterized protein with ParB-like and HNH nuclease domain
MDNLVTLQDLFKNSVFKIPDYQRGYSWENIHRKDLLDDLEAIQISSNSEKVRRHYTGTVVLEPTGTQIGFGESYKKYDVVDGQQRLTTLLILLTEIINQFRNLKGTEAIEANKIADKIEERYLRVEGPQGNIFKLSLDEDNDLFFKQAVLAGKDDVEQTIRSHQNLLKAKVQFKSYFERQRKTLSKVNHFNKIKELMRKITQLLVFTVYSIEDNSEVGVIFEVMNDRGKPLSELEKVKNLLMYMTNRISKDTHSSTQLINKINFSWKEILQNMTKAEKFESEDENQFLRVNAIISFYSDLKTYDNEDGKKVSINSQLADIHGLLKRRFRVLEKDKTTYQCKAYKEIENYVDSLRSSSYRFRDLLKPYENFAFQHVQDSKTKEALRLVAAQFNRMGIEATLLPLNVAIYERFLNQPEIQLSLMQTIEAFAFQVYGIVNYRPYTAQSAIYRISSKIFRDKMSSQKIDSELRKLIKEYVKEDIGGFLKDQKIDYYDWNSLRYFLYEYERYQSAKAHKKPHFEWEELKEKKKEESIEHILPQTIRDKVGNPLRKYWCDRYSPEEHTKNTRRLGNLTLTENNSRLGNKSLDKKKGIYKDSRWEIERELVSYDNWTTNEIDEREEKLVHFAKERWKI